MRSPVGEASGKVCALSQIILLYSTQLLYQYYPWYSFYQLNLTSILTNCRHHIILALKSFFKNLAEAAKVVHPSSNVKVQEFNYLLLISLQQYQIILFLNIFFWIKMGDMPPPISMKQVFLYTILCNHLMFSYFNRFCFSFLYKTLRTSCWFRITGWCCAQWNKRTY